jgi:F0F1-type ATP synthase assembly protein I
VVAMIKNLLDSDQDPEPDAPSSKSSSILSAVPPRHTADTDTITDSVTGKEEPFIITTESPPESIADSVRQSGLAYSAAIAFFASVVFMLIIGWGADLLFGTSPWGMVVGIVIGSIIGFVQFFRINSRIFNPDRKMKNGRTLLSRDEDAK